MYSINFTNTNEKFCLSLHYNGANSYLFVNGIKFVLKVFFLGLTILSNFTNALNAIPLSCILMKNQECKTRPEVININSNNPIFNPFSIKINKCSGNCNNINNPYAKCQDLMELDF